MRLDYREKFPSGMEDYLSYNGWHFNKKMCDFATSNMYKKDGDKKKVYIKPFTRDDVDQLLSTHEIRLERNKGYDYVFDSSGMTMNNQPALLVFPKSADMTEAIIKDLNYTNTKKK